MNRYYSRLVAFGAVAMGAASQLPAATIDYVDDFSDWTLSSNQVAVGADGDGGAWFWTNNTADLHWDFRTVAGSATRDVTWSVTAPDPITSVEFDWRFSNDGFDSRLRFVLLDNNDNVLFSATSTPGGSPKPLNLDQVVSVANASGLKFRWEQLTDSIYGQAGLFAANQDDWDAFVDNVTITTAAAVPEPSSAVLLASGLVMLARSRRR